MAYDGSILLDTKIDTGGVESGLKSITGIVAAGAAAAGAALVAMGAAVIKVGSDFEAGMSKVQAISGASASDMQKLTDIAKEMGEATKFSATESAEALSYMAMAGWKTEQMISGLPGIMNLAAASGEQLGMVSDIVTDALTAFGLAAEDSARFADVLAAASNNSNTNVAMLGESFKYVAPVAGALGFSIEDVSVALGLMANSGIKASMAGTSLRSLFTNLVKPTEQMAAAMEELGIEITNTDGTMKPLNQIMVELRESFSGLTDAEKAMYAATLAGKMGMSGLLAIVNTADEDFDKLTESIANSTGTAQTMADIMNDNLQGQITLLGSALEGVGIQIYEQFQEPLKDATKSAISSVNNMSTAFRDQRMVNALQTLANAFADLAAETADIASEAIPKLVNAFAFLVENGKTVVTIIGSAATAFVTFKAAMTIVPIINAVSAAFTAASGVIALYSSTQAVANGVNAIAAISAAAVSGALTAQEIVVAALTGKIKLAAAAQGLWNIATAAFPGVGIALAVSALAAGIVILAINMEEAETEADRFNDSLENLNAQLDNHADAVKQSSKSHDENIDAIKAESIAADNLASKVTELAAKENKSAADKLRLKEYVDLLNKSVSGLNLSYDAQNDALNMNEEQIRAVTEAQKDRLLQQAREERALELAKEQAEAEMNLAVTMKSREDAQASLSEAQQRHQELLEQSKDLYQYDAEAIAASSDEMRGWEEAVSKATEVEAAAQEQLDLTAQSFDAVADAMVESAEKAEESAAATESAVETFTSVTQENIAAFLESMGYADEAFDKQIEKLADYEAQTTDMWGRINEAQVVSIGEMIDNLEYNTDAVETWSDNLATLAERGVDDGLIATLRNAGPEARASIAGLVDASDEQLEKLEDSFAKGGQVAVNALLREMGVANFAVPIGEALDDTAAAVENNTAIENAAAKKGPATKEALDQSIENTDFPGSGKNIIDGVAKGIVDNVEAIVTAAKDTVDETDKAFSDAADAHSPARRFIPHGENIVLGVVEGIDDKVIELENASRDAVRAAYNAAETEVYNLNFASIGEYISWDMAEGIRNGESEVINAVIAVARAAYEAAKSELDIHSPSKKFAYLGEMSIKGYIDEIKAGKADAVQTTSSVMQQAYAAAATTQNAFSTASTAYQSTANTTSAPVTIDAPLVVQGTVSKSTDLNALARKWGVEVEKQARLKGVL